MWRSHNTVSYRPLLEVIQIHRKGLHSCGVITYIYYNVHATDEAAEVRGPNKEGSTRHL